MSSRLSFVLTQILTTSLAQRNLDMSDLPSSFCLVLSCSVLCHLLLYPAPILQTSVLRPRCIEAGWECLACFGVAWHAAGNLSPSVFVLVCHGSSVHLLWFVSVLLGNSVLALVVCCAPPFATLWRIMRESNRCAHAGLHMADYKTCWSCTCCCQCYSYFVWAYAMPMLQFCSHTARKVCDCCHDLMFNVAGILPTALHVLKCSALQASPQKEDGDDIAPISARSQGTTARKPTDKKDREKEQGTFVPRCGLVPSCSSSSHYVLCVLDLWFS